MILTPLLVALLGAIMAMIVGSIWYSPRTLTGKIHMDAIGFSTLSPEAKQAKIDAIKPHMAKIYSAQFLLSFLLAGAVTFIVIMSMQNGLSFSMVLAFLAVNWLCFIVPAVGAQILWGPVDKKLMAKKFVSDIGAYAIMIVLIALVSSLFVR
jgi:hypothetical protein